MQRRKLCAAGYRFRHGFRRYSHADRCCFFHHHCADGALGRLLASGQLALCGPGWRGEPKNFIVLPNDDTVYSPTHGWSDSQKVVIYNGTPPAGTDEGQILYVRDAGTNTFKLAATDGGAAIDMTSAPSWGAVIAAITEYAYAGTGTFSVESSTIVIPD